MQTKVAPAEIKSGPDAGLAEGEFIAYPSTFTRTPDSYGDVVAPGAFKRGIQNRLEAGIKLPCLFGHRTDDPDYYIGHAISEDEDEHGWKVHGRFDLESPKGAQVYRLVRDGLIRELSFAYEVKSEGDVTLPGGAKARELRDLDVSEFSFVSRGANTDTGVASIKSTRSDLHQRALKVRAAHIISQIS